MKGWNGYDGLPLMVPSISRKKKDVNKRILTQSGEQSKVSARDKNTAEI